MKKIDLHLHLDGSVLVSTAEDILKMDNLKDKMLSTDDNSLEEYLNKFDIPIKVLQTKENIIRVCKDLINTLINNEVIYAEVRFCPLFHTSLLTLDEVVDSVLEGLKSDKVKTNVILCMMRNLSYEENMSIISLAKKYLGKGVCAIDLAGDERKYKLNEFIDLFNIVKENNIPFTIHAGEVDHIDIITAISLGTKRIGHGIKANDKELELIKENNILLEICPTSNIDTKAFNNYNEHNIYDLYRKGVNISINTDNMTVSNIDLNKEYNKLLSSFPFTISDLKKINKVALSYAFLSENEKKELLTKMD